MLGMLLAGSAMLHSGGALQGAVVGATTLCAEQGLLCTACRKNLDPNFELQNEPPSIIGNALCWSLHMGISSNLRYQVLGGTDQVRGGRAPGSWVARSVSLCSSAYRLQCSYSSCGCHARLAGGCNVQGGN
jgi:Protein RETICULATA-related